jgi:hypothetical protein
MIQEFRKKYTKDLIHRKSMQNFHTNIVYNFKSKVKDLVMVKSPSSHRIHHDDGEESPTKTKDTEKRLFQEFKERFTNIFVGKLKILNPEFNIKNIKVVKGEATKTFLIKNDVNNATQGDEEIFDPFDKSAINKLRESVEREKDKLKFKYLTKDEQQLNRISSNKIISKQLTINRRISKKRVHSPIQPAQSPVPLRLRSSKLVNSRTLNIHIPISPTDKSSEKFFRFNGSIKGVLSTKSTLKSANNSNKTFTFDKSLTKGMSTFSKNNINDDLNYKFGLMNKGNLTTRNSNNRLTMNTYESSVNILNVMKNSNPIESNTTKNSIQHKVTFLKNLTFAKPHQPAKIKKNKTLIISNLMSKDDFYYG